MQETENNSDFPASVSSQQGVQRKPSSHKQDSQLSYKEKEDNAFLEIDKQVKGKIEQPEEQIKSISTSLQTNGIDTFQMLKINQTTQLQLSPKMQNNPKNLDLLMQNEINQVFLNFQEQGKIPKKKLGCAFRALRKIISDEYLRDLVSSLQEEMIDKDTFIKTFLEIKEVNPQDIFKAFQSLDEKKQGKLHQNLLCEILQRQDQIFSSEEIEEALKNFTDNDKQVDYSSMIAKIYPEFQTLQLYPSEIIKFINFLMYKLTKIGIQLIKGKAT